MDELDLHVFRIWMKAYKSVMAHVVKDIHSYGLTLENFMVMELLYHKGPHTVQNISEKLMIASGSITNVVNKLEQKGLARRVIEAPNRRYCKVELTEQGKTLFNEIFPQHAEKISERFGMLEDEQKQQLAKILKTVGIAAQQGKPNKGANNNETS